MVHAINEKTVDSVCGLCYSVEVCYLMAAIWHRAGCCCVVACEHCDVGTTPPRKITLVVAGITVCGCLPVSDTYHLAMSVPASVDVVNSVDNPCYWSAVAGTVTLTIYTESECAGDVVSATAYPVRWELTKEDGSWIMSAGSPAVPSYGVSIFYDVQAETDCSNGVTFTSDWAVGDCGTLPWGASTAFVGAYGGTITKAAT